MPPSSNRFAIFILANIAFAVAASVALALSSYPNPRLLYLLLLFALCSSALLDFDKMNGRYALLALFMLVYFVSFGVGDFTNLLPNADPPPADLAGAHTLLSTTEAVIFAGGIVWVLAYRLAAFMVKANPTTRIRKDWSKGAILTVGFIFWSIGTVALYRWNVYIITDTTNGAIRKGLASISPAVTTIYVIAQMCQPFGELLFAYAMTVYRTPHLFLIVVAMVLVQVFIGFVVDIKGVAMLGMILVIMTSFLVNGKVPKAWFVAGVLFVIFLFPFFQAYRAEIHGGGIARTTVVQNFGKILQKTIAAKDKVNTGRERAQTFLERSSVKGSVEVIVTKTGNGVDYQRGHTLSPILAAFVPRILWPEKQTIPTGQLVNKQFHLTDSDDIFISPSYLGELYWNFGWAGAIVGMAILGLICGWIGAGFNLAEYVTVTRVLVTVITIKQLIVGFEGCIADNFIVWLRSLTAIGLLHLLFSVRPAAYRLAPEKRDSEKNDFADGLRNERLFPNLLN